MILVVGEILFDVFPDYRRLGGAPFNFAFHLQKLGFPVRFVSRVGDDNDGKEILEFLHFHGFRTADIQVDPLHETGRVNIEIDTDGGHRFDIVTGAAYDYIAFTSRVADLVESGPELIYFGTLIQRTKAGAAALQKVLKAKEAGTVNFLDINLRPRCYTTAAIETSLAAADILKLNRDELGELAALFDLGSDPATSAGRLIRRFSLEKVLMTKGNAGSDIFTAGRRFKNETGGDIDVKDTVGAGDAWAAMAAAGYLTGQPENRVVSLADTFAARICEIEGALPEGGSLYDQFKQRLEEGHGG